MVLAIGGILWFIFVLLFSSACIIIVWEFCVQIGASVGAKKNITRVETVGDLSIYPKAGLKIVCLGKSGSVDDIL